MLLKKLEQPDTQFILDHINKTSATNMDCKHIEEKISSLLEKQQTMKERYVILYIGHKQ